MKKISIVSFASFVFLLLCSGVAVLSKSFFESALSALVVGVVILIGSGIVAFFAKVNIKINLLCFLLSSVAMGFFIRAWYINRGFENSFLVMCAVSFSAVLYLWLFFALSKIPFIHRSRAFYIVLCVAYAVISILVYVFAVCKTETTYVSTLGYYMIIEFAFIFALSLEVHTKAELIRNLALSTYSVFAVAVIAGVFVIFAALGDGDCDCDCFADGCCDCIDCGQDVSRHNKKKKG